MCHRPRRTFRSTFIVYYGVPYIRQFYSNITITALQFLDYSWGLGKPFELGILCDMNCHIC